MSVIKNIRKFWERFEDEQGSLENALQTKDYPKINEIVAGLNEEANAVSGCSFFVEDVDQDFELTLDPGPNKTSQYIAQRMKIMAPDNVKKNWRINDSLQPLSRSRMKRIRWPICMCSTRSIRSRRRSARKYTVRAISS
ncbi:hypothetical protein [uncultured Dubosiella sp.]|uniref:hypothetical protein n=1 Tax=uncultured Dubosiella sp. TaxID=1937011 RepID=UPI0026229402|nr:hypothetical protein [uncultured Dubosiella sp.]